MVGRPKTDNPKSRLIGVRVTESEGDVLDAMAALDKTTVTEIVRQSMQRAIIAAMQDDHVKDMIALQHRHTKRSTADVVTLKPLPVTELTPVALRHQWLLRSGEMPPPAQNDIHTERWPSLG